MGWWDLWPGYATQPQVSVIELYARLDRMQFDLNGLIEMGKQTMATTQELLDTVTALAAAVEPLPAAIDALEAAIAAVAGIPAADQANIDAAVAALQSITASVSAAVADATDGATT